MKVLKSLAEVEAAGLSPPVRDAARDVLGALIAAHEEHGEAHDSADDHYMDNLTEN